jgi:pyruvate dehydrogenase E1 component alpha subunit
MFQNMFRMRRMELSADMLYKSKQIRGFCHLIDGQEAIAHAIAEAIDTQSDSVITSYRDHGLYLSRVGNSADGVHKVVAELMGRATGASKGKGGSMHMYSRENNFFGGCGIVGAQVPLGAGLAFAHQYKEDGGIGVALYGDGAANQGQVAETLNMAALWSLPCIFVVENNMYGMGTQSERAAKSTAYYARGLDFMPGIKVDGMDCLAVKAALRFCREYVRANGPILIECSTYRYHGHSMSDPGSTYRTRDEVNDIRSRRDPIDRVRRLLIDNGLASATELKQIEKEIRKEIDAAIEKAKAEPLPSLDQLFAEVYVNPASNVHGASARGVRNTYHPLV